MGTIENNDELKTISLELDYADEKGVLSKRNTKIRFNKPVLKDKQGDLRGNLKLIYKNSFSLTIPDHIHSALCGKTIPRTGLSNTKTFTYEPDFSKTVTCPQIEILTEKWRDIIYDFYWIKNIDNLDLKKVIFFSFKLNNSEFKSSWDGTSFGNQIKVEFTFAIGYTSVNKSDKSIIRFNSDKKLINSGYNSEFYSLKVISWSGERENFFNRIQSGFLTIISQLSEFEKNLTEDSIDCFIENNSDSIKIKLLKS